MISDFLENNGFTCTIDGTTLITEWFDEVYTYKYNSTGHMIQHTFSEDNVLGYVYGPNGSGGGDTIPFGNHFLIFVIIGK